MKTNYQMLDDFKFFKPVERGILAADEVEYIEETFEIPNRNDVELQNLRDFIVLFYGTQYENDLDKWDIMSGICGVIDREKFKRGMPV